MAEWTVMQWIDDVTQEPRSRYQEYPDSIKDGVALCKLMNALEPGSVGAGDVSGKSGAAKRIDSFREAASQYGVPEADLFETKDLLEKRNIPSVTHCLQVLAALATQRGFQGPKLNPVVPIELQGQLHSHMARQIFH